MSGVSSFEGTWVEPDTRRTLHYRCWRPASPRALLVIVHGFAEHGGRYDWIARALAERGIWVAAPDVWGHGRSGGARGDLDEMAACVRQLRALTMDVLLPASGQQWYAVYGHSFGGLLGLLWALDDAPGLERLVIQSPWLQSAVPVPRWKHALAYAVTPWWPMCTFRINLDVELLSCDPAVGEAYRTDPLVHNAMSARAYWAIQCAQEHVGARADALRIPVLLLCGDVDRLVSVEAARRWFAQVTCEKRLVVFPGGSHELHHEPVREEVRRLIDDWVTRHG